MPLSGEASLIGSTPSPLPLKADPSACLRPSGPFESDLHLGLYSSLTSANNLNPNLLTLLLYLILTLITSSSIVAVFTAKDGHVLG